MFDSYSPLQGDSGTGPANPAAFDTSVAKFSWNTAGSPAGTYRWHVTAINPFGTDQGSITIHIATVPEPTTLTLVALALTGSTLRNSLSAFFSAGYERESIPRTYGRLCVTISAVARNKRK